MEALAAHAEEHDETGDLPAKGIRAVHDAGLLTWTVGARYGGPGGGLAGTVRLLAALGQGDPSVALISAMTLFAHAAQARTGAWPAGVYASVLAESAERPTLINALRVEPELGTPARGGLPATVARRAGDGWELTGHKIFSTGAPALRWMQVWARTDETPVRTGAFLVRGDAPGIAIDRTWNHLGLRASRSDDVTFAGTPAVAALDLAEPGPPGGDPGGLRSWNALGIGAIYLGVARAARDWLVRYLHERVPANLGAPLATLPRFQAEVGEIEAQLLTAGTLLDTLAARADAGEDVPAGLAKTVATRAAIDAVQRAVALIGNAALTRNNPLQRHLRDVLCGRIHTPQDDAVLGAAGRSALEGPR
ncbi:acyl-CoA dehydrogenase family protein [Spirilliplanes yamanashiensis]|uniref:acyl-CoA dehydrogenase family protein n=1 Tax=Spirilliplanes yamanashiensis TaxID=42233 RepID=UPI001EF17BD5|nr:acyl-CoA dehydrogenase family protein [Spirilliplanes yamanashiensis]MDP9819174.1 alkylation response protein AidB-like acyl-CoA dehydrogenase [Spirilliplanes yamanashiensis]